MVRVSWRTPAPSTNLMFLRRFSDVSAANRMRRRRAAMGCAILLWIHGRRTRRRRRKSESCFLTPLLLFVARTLQDNMKIQQTETRRRKNVQLPPTNLDWLLRSFRLEITQKPPGSFQSRKQHYQSILLEHSYESEQPQRKLQPLNQTNHSQIFWLVGTYVRTYVHVEVGVEFLGDWVMASKQEQATSATRPPRNECKRMTSVTRRPLCGTCTAC